MLLRLPGMTPELAGAIVDWRDEDEVLSDGGGAESEYYLLQSPPHYCKNAPFETLDELLLLKGATSEILFGVDANRNGVVDADEAGAQTTLSGFNGQAQCGICKYLTAYSLEANTSRTGQPRVFVGDTSTQTLTALLVMLSQTLSAERVAAITTKLRQTPRPPANVLDFYVKSGMTIEEFKPVADQLTTDRTRLLTGRVNVNTAPREVLRCLPGMEDGDIDLLLARRANGGGGGTELENIAWVAETLPPAKAALIGGSITTRSFQYSADIVGVSGNGRGFKRFKYVFDIRNTPARTLLRKDLSHTGWPLSAELRGSTGLRAGGETSRGFSLETR
jgi:DNA uptake protein ComE-like DNA-binding protein